MKKLAVCTGSEYDVRLCAKLAKENYNPTIIFFEFEEAQHIPIRSAKQYLQLLNKNIIIAHCEFREFCTEHKSGLVEIAVYTAGYIGSTGMEFDLYFSDHWDVYGTAPKDLIEHTKDFLTICSNPIEPPTDLPDLPKFVSQKTWQR